MTLSSTQRMQRLLSLDVYRGTIMVLLALESSGLYEWMFKATEGSGWNVLVNQFFHHPWNGLRFWDLIQPGFMYIAGVSLAFSLSRQQKEGWTWTRSFFKTLKRSGWLFFWGVLDYAVRPQGLSFELWDVLTQLSFTTLLAFLIFRWSMNYQILFCAGLLLLTEVLYRFTHVPGFDQPFTDQHNFGNYMDLLLMNKINGGGWVAINCIPTAVHTIAGAITGKLLLEANSFSLRKVVGAAIVVLLAGYLLDGMGITPIIKRIATSSFTLASLGWCLLGLAFFYWWIDRKGHSGGVSFFTVVGMNSLFIYLFFEIVGHRWFNEYVTAVVSGVLSWVNASANMQQLFSSLGIFALEWGMCYFLYTRKIFFRV
jgi:predicted acyltransferase